MDIEPGKRLLNFLQENDFKEETVREVLTNPVFKAFCYAYQRDMLKHRKISINFIRELRSNVKIDWDLFMNDKHEYYTEEEKNKLIKEFKLICKKFFIYPTWEESEE